MNVSPVKGYEKDVGTKTTIRITYPEGAPRKNNLYDVDALLGIVVFKLADLNWLDSVLHRKTPSTKGFWSKIAMSVPKNPRQTRIINPLIIREASFDLLGYPTNLGKMNKNVPTSGTISIMLALRLCDEVDVVGFGYNTKEPEALIHYYEKVKMKIITSLFTHDINHETAFLKKLVEFGVIRDLTGGLS
ncbi:CMP-N-acetylneuraminate-beta-1,4-galactoside alpha-2,3-sialyltransferase-like [Saccoglossus kowalevskii]|uniref:CMP-N-acetylneuraminate-beta-1,4-galactoside alpha-2,3-sialyltransferase-like n=1 Tax=Saccoglossus kowalevskii TaxID=10224 RepID=A0ABM0MQL3_SACKO|nr:PREDICTED: CMP-N-acetylneuraminate-beta-1,4-galactoside alpha-2,3-sialyltransferase-like [Saccoglossus kowalevskii]